MKLSVQTLCRFGHEATMEAQPGCFTMRTVNMAKSAYVRMNFVNTFFDAYELFDQPVIAFGVLTKSLAAALKTHRICRAVFEVFPRTSKMVVFLDCENGLQKKFELNLIDSEPLQAEVNFDMFPVRILVESGEMARLMASFQSDLEDLTIIATPDSHQGKQNASEVSGGSCQIHSFYDPSKVDASRDGAGGTAPSLLHTQLTLNGHSHFLEYHNSGSEPLDVTFNLKDFRSVLHFCNQTKQNMQIIFSESGEPISITPVSPATHFAANANGFRPAPAAGAPMPMPVPIVSTEFDVEFILATMLNSCVNDGNGDAHRGVSAAPANATDEAHRPSIAMTRNVATDSAKHHPSHQHNSTCPPAVHAEGNESNGGNMGDASRSSLRRAADQLIRLNQFTSTGTTDGNVIGSAAARTKTLLSDDNGDGGAASANARSIEVVSKVRSKPIEYNQCVGEGEDEDSDEIPGTPPDERDKGDNWTQLNWS